jgi:hypothetical protein
MRQVIPKHKKHQIWNTALWHMKLQSICTKEEKVNDAPTWFFSARNSGPEGEKTSDIGYQDVKLDSETKQENE